METEEGLVKKRQEAKERFIREEISAEEYNKIKENIEKEMEEIEKSKSQHKQELPEKSKKDDEKQAKDTTVEKKIAVKGMVCHSCEKIIKKQALSLEGVNDISVDYSSGKGYVKFDQSKIDIDTILDKIEENGYKGMILEESHGSGKQMGWFGFISAILGIIVVGYFLLRITDKIQLPQISPNIGYGLLFLTGLLTGFHCVAMCGGFVISYTAKHAKEGKSSRGSHIAYGAGKLISYTVIGAAFGFIGSIIAFTPLMRGIAGILAGAFLILFGLSMLDVSPIFRKFRLGIPKFLTVLLGHKHGSSSPFKIGLLNGLMIACGPLQAIYIMAAGTGSAIEGAKLMFVFGLGTLPVMLSFGYLTSIISARATHKILKISGIVVIILGLIMVNRGLALTGTGYDAGSILSFGSGSSAGSNAVTGDGFQEIKMDVLASGWSPNKFVLKKGVPVKWVINGKQITGCNNAIQVPKLGLNFKIKEGLQTIEFTPNEEGTIPFSCWMGMIRGNFIVKDEINLADEQAVQKEIDAVKVPAGGSCGGGGGGCGCGAR